MQAGGLHDVMVWTQGTGENEGWSYIALLSGLASDDTMEARGVLYRGDLPPTIAAHFAAP